MPIRRHIVQIGAVKSVFTGPVFVVRDNIDTDQIISAQYLNLVPTIAEEYEKLGAYAMDGLPKSLYPTRYVEEGQLNSKYPIVIGGRNFGCGSSREHAPIAMGSADCELVLAESFARIFFRNCVATGELYPCECADRLCDDLKTGDVVTVDLDKAIATVRQALDRTVHPSEVGAQASQEFMIGRSASMQEVFRRIALVADLDLPVLITGESGTGKDLVARAIHRHSRREGPFVPICIPALSESLVESELFGHLRGAFTGASDERLGLLEAASGGTAFVDEIGDVSLNLQAKLLRTLETREILPVGSREFRQATFRLVAATNRPLESMVAQGGFRSDLYYRLNVFRIEIPPLRERTEDIPELATAFVFNATVGRRSLTLSDAAITELCQRPWYGNVRELRNTIESAVVVCRGDTILPEHLPAPMPRLNPVQTANDSPAEQLARVIRQWTREQLQDKNQDGDLYQRFLTAVETTLIDAALDSVDGNRGAAAKLLGIHRETLREKLRRQPGDPG